MSLVFNAPSGFAYLETEEAAPWASLGCRPYTHFVLLETTTSQANAQYVWSTGNTSSANSLNMYFTSTGNLVAYGGTGTIDSATPTISPSFGGGLLRLAVMRGLGVQNSNVDFDYQAVNLGALPGSSSVQISSSSIRSYTTGGSNALAATKLTLGDRQTTPGDRKFFGTMHFAGSVNRALDDNELIAILTGDIPVLDYFKHDLVELWDFQRSDASALTGLISGTTFKMFGGGNLSWDQSAPLPVSRFRGKTILGATNRIVKPVWSFGESGTGVMTLSGTSVKTPNTSTEDAVEQTFLLLAKNNKQTNKSEQGAVSQDQTFVGKDSKQVNSATTGSILQTISLTADSVKQANSATAGQINPPDPQPPENGGHFGGTAVIGRRRRKSRKDISDKRNKEIREAILLAINGEPEVVVAATAQDLAQAPLGDRTESNEMDINMVLSEIAMLKKEIENEMMAIEEENLLMVLL